jgi:hypothetical protein
LEEVDDEKQHCPHVELGQISPVVLSPDNATVRGSGKMVEEAPSFNKNRKCMANIRCDLKNLDDFIQEFMHVCYPCEHNSKEPSSSLSQPFLNSKQHSDLNELLFRCIKKHTKHVKKMERISEKDIPCL